MLILSDDKLTDQPFAYSVPGRCTDIDKDLTVSPHNSVWSGHLRWESYVLIYLLTLPQTQNGSQYQVDRYRVWFLEDQISDMRTLSHLIEVGEFSVVWQKVSATSSLLTSNHVSTQIAITLIIMIWVRLREREIKFRTKSKINGRQR